MISDKYMYWTFNRYSLVKLVYNLQLIATQGFLSANYNMDLY